MNKTFIAVTFLILVGLGIVGAATLYVLAPDKVGEFVTSIVTILGVGSAAIVTIYGLGQQGQKLAQQDKTLDVIKANTNGNLTAKENKIQELREILVANGINPDRTPGDHAG